jgi:RNA polymerase sigma factor (TIGR02999 family)
MITSGNRKSLVGDLMGTEPTEHVTRLLVAARNGEDDAASELLTLIYEELRRLARGHMLGVPPGDTLQPTALVHEAYLRLFGRGAIAWENRAHFFYAAGRAMRDIVVEQARRHASLKRGGGRRRVTLDEQAISAEAQADDLVALDGALHQLEQTDGVAAQIVLLRYFAGLTVPDTARALNLSPATVDRYWRYARAWLREQLLDGETEA